MAMAKQNKQHLAELKVEHYAATDYFERTGKDYYKLSPTKQRKLRENWREKHDLFV